MFAVYSILLFHFESTNACSTFIQKIEKRPHKKLFYIKQDNNDVEIKIISKKNQEHLEYVLSQLAKEYNKVQC